MVITYFHKPCVCISGVKELTCAWVEPLCLDVMDVIEDVLDRFPGDEISTSMTTIILEGYDAYFHMIRLLYSD